MHIRRDNFLIFFLLSKVLSFWSIFVSLEKEKSGFLKSLMLCLFEKSEKLNKAYIPTLAMKTKILAAELGEMYGF